MVDHHGIESQQLASASSSSVDARLDLRVFLKEQLINDLAAQLKVAPEIDSKAQEAIIALVRAGKTTGSLILAALQEKENSPQ